MNGWYTGRAVDSGCLEPTASARRRLLVHREFCCEDLTWAHSSAPSGLGAFVHRRKGSAPLTAPRPNGRLSIKFENGRPKLLRRETVSGCRRIFLTRFQLCRRKVRMIRGIRKVLCLQTKTGPMLVNDATLAFVRTVKKVTAIELQARFGRQNFHEYSRGRLVSRSD